MHKSNDIRSASETCVTEGLTAADIGGEDPTPLGQICLQLADCADIMPRALCDLLDLPPGSSYAEGAAKQV